MPPVILEDSQPGIRRIMASLMELNEQTLEQILTRQREEYERLLDASSQETRLHMGVLIEDVKSDIKLISESFGEMQHQLVALRDMVAKNTEDIELIKVDTEIMRSELSIIRRDLKEKAGRDELAVLEARVAVLERSARTR
jgi:hypothetical protein